MIDGKVVYIDPDSSALFVEMVPGTEAFAAYRQQGDRAPRAMMGRHFKEQPFATYEEAMDVLAAYVANERHNGSRHHSWEVLVNGKRVSWDDYYAMNRNEMPPPAPVETVSLVTLTNIEYRISQHMHGAYGEMLAVGHCLNEAKDAGLVPHGQWEAWVRQHTGFSERQAQKLMQAARSVPAGSMMGQLPLSKIQVLLALPEPEREEMAKKAVNDKTSLRELQRAVAAKNTAEREARERQEALEAFQRQADAEKERMQAKQEQLLERIAALESAPKEAGASGISAEAQEEIDRLKDEILELEQYAEQQAALRQDTQRELLEAKQQAARGDILRGGTGSSLSVEAMTAAVGAFIGSAGALPHMGVMLAGVAEAERQQYILNVERIADWVEGARKALQQVEVPYDIK